ncbi:excalibur calcium-binding domain-containing protein [Glycomyces sp. NPDC049804]|uniref:excalibur calcium-binding domain-containing protein n=1 Tax=Glycomyces sp. NPDC049804 TaxID=3154363 RepID=UPI00344A7960
MHGRSSDDGFRPHLPRLWSVRSAAWKVKVVATAAILVVGILGCSSDPGPSAPTETASETETESPSVPFEPSSSADPTPTPPSPTPSSSPPKSPSPPPPPPPPPPPTTSEDEDVYYENCDAARADDAAPLYEGEPGYASHLDADGDGVACEPYFGDGENDGGGNEDNGDSDTYYENCAAARADGAAPLYEGDPGYSDDLDRDGDGVACEN